MRLVTVALWNADGEVRPINLRPGLNVITGVSGTGKSALLEIIRYCLGSDELNVPAGPIEDTVRYVGALVEVAGTPAFVGRPVPPVGQQTHTAAHLLVGVRELPAFDELAQPNTNRDGLRDWIAGRIGLVDGTTNLLDESGGSVPRARLAHALVHCFQRQDEIASRLLLFHNQAEPWMPAVLRQTLPYFLGVTGAREIAQAERLRELQRDLRTLDRQIADAEQQRDTGLGQASTLLAEAAEAGMVDEDAEAPTSLPGALSLLQALLVAPPVAAPRQPAGAELDRLTEERRDLLATLGALVEQRRITLAVEQSATALERESVEQVVRLQPLNLLLSPEEPASCPICQQPLTDAVPAVTELQGSLDRLEQQIGAVERDRPSFTEERQRLRAAERRIRDRVSVNSRKLEAIADARQAVSKHRDQLNLGSYVRGRISQYLQAAPAANEGALRELGERRKRLRDDIAGLEQALDPNRIRARTESVLTAIGRRTTEIAQLLDLEHADTNVRISFERLTVVADTARGPVYMSSGGIGSAKNWVGYHLASVMSLQEHFIAEGRPVPSLLVLDQPTQAFFPSGRQDDERVTDEDYRDALRQFEAMAASVDATGGRLQILVLDHADFPDEFYREAVVESWRDGQALIPQAWSASDVPSPEAADGSAESSGDNPDKSQSD